MTNGHITPCFAYGLSPLEEGTPFPRGNVKDNEQKMGFCK
jgi:hypothetical protein